MMFGLMLLPILLSIGGAVDFGRWLLARQQTISALDAAALAGARALQVEDASTAAAILMAQAMYKENTKKRLPLKSDTIVFNVGADKASIEVTGKATLQTYFLSLANITELPLLNTTGTEFPAAVVAGGKYAQMNIEIAMMLDLSGSMVGQKIEDLKAAAKDLVDIVIWEDQSKYTSRIALVPYANAVNVGSYASKVRGTYTSGTCASPGCQYFKFTNPYGWQVTHQISNCVTERIGADAYTDTAPSTSQAGRYYPSQENPCLTNQIVPLSSDKTYLEAQIDSFEASGSTGGQVGVAWGWYLLSPNFAYLWPSTSRPDAYKLDKTQKIAILMTDGEYNSVHCKGVIAQDSTYGSGSISEQINCNATNGDAYKQSLAVCDAMKTAGVTVYTVAFQVYDSQNAKDLLAKCATDSTKSYDAQNGEELKQVFHDIALKISTIYLSH